ncbi:MAG: NAD-dependent epimerase/dehydratase family protein [bacterium]
MKVLVTGGAGFIGSHVVDMLLARGNDVAVVDDLSSGRRENVNPSARFFEVDVRDGALAGVFEEERPEAVIHTAAQISVAQSVRDPVGDADINLIGGLRILEVCREFEVGKVIFSASGGTVYGEVPEGAADEDTPPAPLSPYGIAKMAFENYLEFYRHEHGLRYTVLRYGNVYGPRQDPHGEAGVVAIFARAMLAGEAPTINGDGKYYRDYVYVSDVAEANCVSLERGDNRRYNIGTQTAADVNEVYRMLREATGFTREPKHGPPRPGDLRRVMLDITRAREELGWEPRVSVSEGMRKTVEFFRGTV